MRCVKSLDTAHFIYCGAGKAHLGLVAHSAEQFVVVGSALHAFLDKLHCFDRVAVGKEAAENPHTVERFLAEQQVVAAGGGGHDVDCGEDTLVGKLAVELQLHVARSLEFLEDDLVHL